MTSLAPARSGCAGACIPGGLSTPVAPAGPRAPHLPDPLPLLGRGGFVGDPGRPQCPLSDTGRGSFECQHL
eukprot:6036341-Alexandrium_andersonii.AAC.1